MNGSYAGYNSARSIDLRTLHERPDDVALLRDVWQDPAARDPRARAAAVTEEIAATLAELASALERRGHAQERVARYLMRCVFTMFAEDVGLLLGEPFRAALEHSATTGTAAEFDEAVGELWAAMDTGGRIGWPAKRQLLRFNGHFFKERETLPLEAGELATLRRAALADWQHVEPTIFGTLLTRALDPEERHRLGAEYTPRAFIERIVRPTVEEPIRERWTLVQAEVLQLTTSEGRSARRDLATAVQRVDDFLAWLRSLRFLDPACGSGNFLYVTLSIVKQVELEAVRERERITGTRLLRMEEVDPAQFHGIEVKPWAREIAELTLWIGFHQFWRAHHDVQPPEPVLRDTGTLECRDAVLAWDEIRHDPSRDRLDSTPRIIHPVTGLAVPDPEARLKFYEYVGARPAAWPEADFIVGNPPFIGRSRQRDALGDGYVTALRGSYPDVPVHDALGEAEGLVAPQVQAKGLHFAVDACAGGLLVRADREKLRQILVNLLSNAVKFTDRGGRVELRCEARDGRVLLRVRDSGIGIPADKLAAIFEPFVQVRADLTRTAEGTGLGLAISRDLARGMEGELGVESVEGAGSTFTLTLPRAKGE